MDDFSFLDIPVGLPDEVLSSSQSEVVNVSDKKIIEKKSLRNAKLQHNPFVINF